MAKKRKAKQVKSIAGVRIPKALRPATRVVARGLNSPLGKEIIAEAVVAFMIALARSGKMRRALKQAGREARESGAGVGGVFLHLGRAIGLPLLLALHDRLGVDEESAPPPSRRGKKARNTVH